jgi:hypothetical protein
MYLQTYVYIGPYNLSTIFITNNIHAVAPGQTGACEESGVLTRIIVLCYKGAC